MDSLHLRHSHSLHLLAADSPRHLDIHLHPVAGLGLAVDVDLSGVQSAEEIHRRLAEASASRAPDAWVQAWGLDPNAFGGRPLTGDLIDDAVGRSEPEPAI